MTIELTPEHQRMTERVMHLGGYHDAQEVIGAALEALADDVVDVAPGPLNVTPQRVSSSELLRKWCYRTEGFSKRASLARANCLRRALGGCSDHADAMSLALTMGLY